ncbi:MAG: transporter [Pseudomonadota bacterium]
MHKILLTLIAFNFSFMANAVSAEEQKHEHHPVNLQIGSHGAHRADGHAPIGVMGDHMHAKGEWMLSYRYMRMEMKNSRDGSSGISPDEIATTVANPFFGQPMQPPTLRVVPTQMTMDMHMFGAMYAPTDWLTLMLMGSYIKKDMDHITFMGPAGTTRRGEFTTRSSGFGDTKIGGLIRLYDDDTHHFHLNAGLSLPTGSISEDDDVLAPTGATPTLNLPYPMQLGSGTFDLLPGITYTGKSTKATWGAQYSAVIRLEDENYRDYSLGDEHRLTAWGSYSWKPWVSTSLRIAGQTIDEISGQDPNIVAPVQTADPDNQGGDRVDLLLGMNLIGQSGAIAGHRLAFEFGAPIYQHLNGPQLETDWTFSFGYQKAF